MRLLILGDVYNLFVLNFAESIRKTDKSIQVDILSNRVIVPEKFDFEGKELPYHTIYNNESLPKFINRIPILRTYCRRGKARKALQIINNPNHKYDVILIQGFWEYNVSMLKKIITKNSFLIGSIWGSDFYKRESDTVFKAMYQCNLINVGNPIMIKDLLDQTKLPETKIRNCKFGLAPLEHVYRLKELGAEVAKEKMGFSKDEFLITCGYNAQPNQQHLKIIESLRKARQNLPSTTKIILPMTYGGKPEYKMQVRSAIENSGLKYHIYEKFLTDEEVALLRKSTDIMIQLQVTDAFSGSMQEHLLAQNIVITGSWLPYQVLRESGIFYETIDSMVELENKLNYVFNNIDEIKNNVHANNTAEKFKGMLWSESIKDWIKMMYEYKNNES